MDRTKVRVNAETDPMLW